MSATSEPTPADRKVVLLRLLARREAERQGITPSDAEVRKTARWFRARFELHDLERFAAWLRYAGLDLARFDRVMFEMATLTEVLQHYGASVDERVGDHLAMHTVQRFIGEQVEQVEPVESVTVTVAARAGGRS